MKSIICQYRNNFLISNNFFFISDYFLVNLIKFFLLLRLRKSKLKSFKKFFIVLELISGQKVFIKKIFFKKIGKKKIQLRLIFFKTIRRKYLYIFLNFFLIYVKEFIPIINKFYKVKIPIWKDFVFFNFSALFFNLKNFYNLLQLNKNSNIRLFRRVRFTFTFCFLNFYFRSLYFIFDNTFVIIDRFRKFWLKKYSETS